MGPRGNEGPRGHRVLQYAAKVGAWVVREA